MVVMICALASLCCASPALCSFCAPPTALSLYISVILHLFVELSIAQ